MKVTAEIIKNCAKLGSLELTEEEIPQYQEKLSEILTLIDELLAIDTRGVAPTSHVHGVVNAFREDMVAESFKTEELRSMAPSYVGSGYRVPKIID